MSNKRIWISLFFISIIIGTVFSENMITIYSHNPGDVGGGLVEIIDIDFYQDGMIKRVSSYRPGRSINTWEDDNGERDSLEIAWHFPQIEIVRDSSIAIIKKNYYNDNLQINEKKIYKNIEILRPDKISSWKDNVNNSVIYKLEEMGDYATFYSSGERGSLIRTQFDEMKTIDYKYVKSGNFYSFSFQNKTYKYDYFELDEDNSRFEYEINYERDGLYSIYSYDKTDSERIFVNKYIIQAMPIEMTNVASCINYMALPTRFRPLLPFFTISEITNPDLVQSK